MEGNDTFASAQTAVDDIDLSDLNDLPRPFDTICSELTDLGALSVDDFLSNSTDYAKLDVALKPQAPVITPSADAVDGGDVGTVATEGGPPTKPNSPRGMLAMLHQTTQKMFGSSNPLKFEFIEEDPLKKQCILTITRPNGLSRSYKSDPGFAKKAEAKAQAARIAIDMGALDFIVAGDSDAVKAKKGLLLNPSDFDMESIEAVEAVVNDAPRHFVEEAIKQIDDCCVEWRAGLVKPHWVVFNDSKNKKKHGMALRIMLSPHVFRSWAVLPTYDTAKAAKIACAQHAIDDGVLDFIKFGNGQTEPLKKDLDDNATTPNDKQTSKAMTLQEYFETLPRPFPEDTEGMTAAEINAPAWINTALQSARGGRVYATFIPIVDNSRHLHGSILRIERPEEIRTYLADPQFPKRADARAAVCLLAMSQGIGEYVRQLKEEAEGKLPPERRKLANEKIMAVLLSECGKVRPGNRMQFDFTMERDAYGCSLKIDISPDAENPDVREYTVEAEYRTKSDAKAAVVCHAAEQGLVDLLKFKGEPLPEGHIPFWDAQTKGASGKSPVKRKDAEREAENESRDNKKRRKGARELAAESGRDRFRRTSRGTDPYPQQKPSIPTVNEQQPRKNHRVVSDDYNLPKRSRTPDRPSYHRRGTSSVSQQSATPSTAPAPPPYYHDARTNYLSPHSYPASLPPPGPYHVPYPPQPHYSPSSPPTMAYPTYYPAPPPPPPPPVMPYNAYPYPYPYGSPYAAQPAPLPAPYPSGYAPSPVLYTTSPLPQMMSYQAIPTPIMAPQSLPVPYPHYPPVPSPGHSPHHYSMGYGAPPVEPTYGGYYPPHPPPSVPPPMGYPDQRAHSERMSISPPTQPKALRMQQQDQPKGKKGGKKDAKAPGAVSSRRDGNASGSSIAQGSR